MENIKKEEGYNPLDIDLNENKIKNLSSDVKEIDFIEISTDEMKNLISSYNKQEIHFSDGSIEIAEPKSITKEEFKDSLKKASDELLKVIPKGNFKYYF